MTIDISVGTDVLSIRKLPLDRQVQMYKVPGKYIWTGLCLVIGQGTLVVVIQQLTGEKTENCLYYILVQQCLHTIFSSVQCE